MQEKIRQIKETEKMIEEINIQPNQHYKFRNNPNITR